VTVESVVDAVSGGSSSLLRLARGGCAVLRRVGVGADFGADADADGGGDGGLPFKV
jgi:hypothetical protein